MMKKWMAFFLLALPPAAFSQAFQQEIPPEDQRVADAHAEGLYRAYREVTAPLTPVVFSLYAQRRKIGYATSIGEGRFLAKWSELAREPSLILANKAGEGVFAKVSGVYVEHDLAILKADGLAAPPVKWTRNSRLVEGAFIAAVDHRGEALSLGVVSVPVRSLRDQDQGFLGIEAMLQKLEKGVRVSKVVSGSAAERAGMKGGDIILEIEGVGVDGFYELSSKLRTLKAGRKSSVKVLRDGQEMFFEPTLDPWTEPKPLSDQIEKMDQMSGSQSRVRDEFPVVLQSDMGLESHQTGMPVVSLDGGVEGLVIARAGRISTLILPAALISELLKKEPTPVNNVGQVPPQKNPQAPRFQRAPVESNLDQLRKALEELERMLGR